MIYNLPRKKKGETWMFRDYLEFNRNGAEFIFEINFISNSQTFSKIKVEHQTTAARLRMDMFSLFFDSTLISTTKSMGPIIAFYIPEAYRAVTFLEPPTGAFLSWLENNAVKQ